MYASDMVRERERERGGREGERSMLLQLLLYLRIQMMIKIYKMRNTSQKKTLKMLLELKEED